MSEFRVAPVDEFNVLVSRLTPGIKGIVHKLHTRSPVMDGDDLTQSALVHLWELFSRGSAQDKTTSYLLQGCYHHLRNQLRLRRHSSMGSGLEEEQDIQDPHSLEDQYQGEILLRSVYEAGLTAREGSVLSQLLDGLTVREIGARLDVSAAGAVLLFKERFGGVTAKAAILPAPGRWPRRAIRAWRARRRLGCAWSAATFTAS